MTSRFLLLMMIAVCTSAAHANSGGPQTAVSFAAGLPDFPPLQRAAIQQPQTATLPGPGDGTIHVVTGQSADGGPVWWLLHKRPDGSSLQRFAMETDASGTSTATLKVALDPTANTTRTLELSVTPARDTLLYRWQSDFASARIPLGRPLPPFSVVTRSGGHLDPARLRGSIVVLNSWATWCVPCIEELPALNALVKKYAGKSVKFVAILETASSTDLQSFLKKHPFAYTQTLATDSSRRIFSESYPQHAILGPDGKVVYASSGGSAHIDRELSVVLDELLKRERRSKW